MFIVFWSCVQKKSNAELVYSTKHIEIIQLSDALYMHVSQLKLKNGALVPCNGLVFIDNNEAVIFDTPTSNDASKALIQWVEDSLQSKITAVIPTHFHIDCLGGLTAFHDSRINSIAHDKTIALARNNGNKELPKMGFDKTKELLVGHERVNIVFFGEGHTADNVVAYMPKEHALFGGCLIKSIDASKGNLEDANIKQWPNTIKRIKEEYKDLKIIVPGHGKHGTEALLDYTIALFQTEHK